MYRMDAVNVITTTSVCLFTPESSIKNTLFTYCNIHVINTSLLPRLCASQHHHLHGLDLQFYTVCRN